MRLGVLRQREFRLMFLAQGVSVLGDRMVAVALAFAVLGLGGSASEVGLVLACRMLPMIACLVAGGVVADRVSRRSVMVVADVVRLGSQGLMAALLIGGAAHVWTLAVLSGVTGAAIAAAGQVAATSVLVAIPEVRRLPAFPATELAGSRTSR